MTKEEYLKRLEVFKDFKFFEEDHHYEYKGKRVGISVTRFIEDFCNEFDAESIAEKVATKQGKTIQQVLDEWKKKNEFACKKGSACHEYAQALWSKSKYFDRTWDGIEYIQAVDKIQKQALKFRIDFENKLEHLADEFVVGSAEYDIASAIDHLFINKMTGGLVLVDYKTNSDIHKTEKYAKKMKVPLSHLKDFTLNHYFIQLSIYRFLVEKYSGLKIEDMFIVYFSENIENYEIIEIPYLKKEVEEILENRRILNMKSVGILLMGGSGTGKSTSLRNLPVNETVIVNVTNKPMPFRNKNGIQIVSCTDYDKIIQAILKTDKKIIVIDDSSYLMTFENFDKATIKGYDKYTTMGVNYYNLITTPIKCDNEKIIYFITHEEIDENGIAHPKTIGKMLSNQLVVEGLFSIVLRSQYKNGEYIFQTQNDGTSVCKSPIDMFENKEIPNDLYEVDKIVREYYGFKSLEEVKDGNND